MFTTDEAEIRTLYQNFLDAWNNRDADAYASFVDEKGSLVGFDGSMMNGPDEIRSTLSGIFAHHQTATYISIVREVYLLSPDVALLRAVVGMVPRGKHELNPDVNSVQSLVAVKHEGTWRIALFQNTPAQFHGRPEEAQALTDELKALLK
jgi:uncharacterized protein (TIGR02246 family)